MKQAMFFVVLTCFACFRLYAQSLFYVLEASEEAGNDIEWIGLHVEYPGPIVDNFQEYVFRNNGGSSHTVRFVVCYQYFSDIPPVLFMVNDAAVQHQINDGKELFEANFYAFYDVVFPANEATKIRVYDLCYLKTDPGLVPPFNGIPRFTIRMSNSGFDSNWPNSDAELCWINDILFNRGKTSFVSILEQEGLLSNRFFTVRKTSGNTWEMEFTALFVEEHRSNLEFEKEWGSWRRRSDPPNGRGFIFDSGEKIAPYRYIFLTNSQLRLLRNSYFARHGYIFGDSDLRSMFEGVTYFGNIHYQPNPGFTGDMLTETDRANIATIQRLEALAGE